MYEIELYMYISVLIHVCGETLTLHSSLFGPDDTVNYDYVITNSINS